MQSLAIGVDLGGTKINAGVVDASGAIVARLRQETLVAAGGAAIIQQIVEVVQTLLGQHGSMPVGIASPGLISFPDGVVLGCTPNLPDWSGLNLKALFQEKLQVPVVVDNDADAAAWGEYRVGRFPPTQHFVMLTLGTGLGSGVIVNGHLLRGSHGLGIGYGHMIVETHGRMCNCGQQGCLEAYVSGKGLSVTYQELGGAQDVAGPAIFEQAASGDRLSQQTVQQFIALLAVGVANIFNTLAPERVVIGGGISTQGEQRLLQPLREQVSAVMSMPFQHAWQALQLATLGANAGLIGAALQAMEESHEFT